MRRHANFQRHICSIRLRTGRFFNTDWLILFIPMQWTHFQSWQMGIKVCKFVQLTNVTPQVYVIYINDSWKYYWYQPSSAAYRFCIRTWCLPPRLGLRLPTIKIPRCIYRIQSFWNPMEEMIFCIVKNGVSVSSKVCISDMLLTPITTLLVVLIIAVESVWWKGLRIWSFSFSCSWWNNFFISHPTPCGFRS